MARSRKSNTFSPDGTAIAVGGIMTVLLDELVNLEVLTVDEVRGILHRVDSGIATMPDTEATIEASRFITDLFSRFPEERS